VIIRQAVLGINSYESPDLTGTENSVKDGSRLCSRIGFCWHRKVVTAISVSWDKRMIENGRISKFSPEDGLGTQNRLRSIACPMHSFALPRCFVRDTKLPVNVDALNGKRGNAVVQRRMAPSRSSPFPHGDVSRSIGDTPPAPTTIQHMEFDDRGRHAAAPQQRMHDRMASPDSSACPTWEHPSLA
jgi:hypothetical protein